MTVVNVGDGACTIFEGRQSLLILDCGEYRGARRNPAAKLRAALRGRESQVSALVVSHFDDDHWTGLQALPKTQPPFRGNGEPLPIYYPYVDGVTRDLWPGTLALISTRRHVGVKALNLRQSWQRAGRTPLLHPVAAGTKFRAADRTWNVVWPPRRLIAGDLDVVSEAITRLREVAEDLARAGFPELRNNLSDAYEDDFLRVGAHGDADSLLQDEENTADDPTATSELWDITALSEPQRVRVREVVDSIRFINNSLSIVMESEDGEIATFGDCESTALRQAVRGLAPRYRVILAPHHGTHGTANDVLPHAKTCIAQQGDTHVGAFPLHSSAHRHSNCISTSLQNVATISL